MIKAEHKKWAFYLFNFYLWRLLKRNFSSINICNKAPDSNPDLPLIFISNHSSWWDGFIIFFLNRLEFKRKFYIMVLERTLAKYIFFRKLGAFSIDLNQAISQKMAIQYCLQILNEESSSALTLFPQGTITLNNHRPLNFKKGIDKILNMYQKDIQILPLSIKLIFLNEKKPSIFIYHGNLLSKEDVLNNDDILENEVESNLNLIDCHINRNEYQEILNNDHRKGYLWKF